MIVNISYVTASQLVQEIFDDYYEFDDHEDSQKHDLKESGSRVSSAFAKPQPGRPIGQSIFANTDIPGETSTGNEHFPEIPVEMCWDMLQGLSECCTHPQDTDQQSINDTNDNNSSPINVSRDGSDGDESDDMSPDIGMNAADNHQKVLEYRMLQDMHALQLHDSKHAYRASALNQCCQLAGKHLHYSIVYAIVLHCAIDASCVRLHYRNPSRQLSRDEGPTAALPTGGHEWDQEVSTCPTQCYETGYQRTGPRKVRTHTHSERTDVSSSAVTAL